MNTPSSPRKEPPMKVQAESKFNVGDWVRIGEVEVKILNVDYRAELKGEKFIDYLISENKGG